MGTETWNLEGEGTPPERQDLVDERRAQILRAALACMARKGYARTTMDDIAREAGLSKGAIYWYFPSKREMFLTMVREFLERTVSVLAAQTAQGADSPSERLSRMLQVLAALFAEEQDAVLVTVDFWSLSRHDEEFTRLFHEAYQAFQEMVEGLLAEGVRTGEFRPMRIREVARLLLGMYDGLFFHAAMGLPVDWAGLSQAWLELLRPEGRGGTGR